MNTKKPLVILLLAVLCTGLFSSCTSDTEPEAGGQNRKLVIQTVSMFGGTDPNAQVYQQINQAFQDQYPYVTIEDNSTVSNEEWKDQIALAFAAGGEPDVLQFFTDANGDEVYQAKQFVSVDEIKAKYPDYAGDIKPFALESMKRREDGVAYAVPTTGYYEGIYCNKDLFSKYGLALPTDWDKLMTAITTFRQQGIIPISASLMEVPHYWIDHLILSEGGLGEHSANPTTMEEVPDSWIRGLERFKQIRDMGAFPDDTDMIKDAAAGDYFRQGKSAMELDGSWFAKSLTGENMAVNHNNVTIVPMPATPGSDKKPGDMITGFSSGFHITKKGWEDEEKQPVLVDFVKLHTCKASINDYWKGSGTAAAECPIPSGLDSLLADGVTLVATASGTDNAIDARLKPQAWKTLTGGISALSSGKKSAEELLEAVVAANR